MFGGIGWWRLVVLPDLRDECWGILRTFYRTWCIPHSTQSLVSSLLKDIIVIYHDVYFLNTPIQISVCRVIKPIYPLNYCRACLLQTTKVRSGQARSDAAGHTYDRIVCGTWLGIRHSRQLATRRRRCLQTDDSRSTLTTLICSLSLLVYHHLRGLDHTKDICEWYMTSAFDFSLMLLFI